MPANLAAGWLSELDSKDDAVRARAEKMERHIYEVEDRLLGRLTDIMGDETLMCVCSDHGATPMGPILNTAHALKEAGLCSYEPKKSENYWDIYEETEGFNYVLDVSKSVAVPQRYMFVYVNLKDKYPGGIVEAEDYEKVRDQIIDALLDYKHPETGERPVLLAVRREDAHVFGMGGAQAGDVVYVLRQHHEHLAPLHPRIHQQGNVALPLTQRRQGNGKHMHPVVEVRTHFLFAHHMRKILVGGRNEPE